MNTKSPLSSESIGAMNEKSAKLIVDQLVKQGVGFFCVAPGSRSTPLAIAIAEQKTVPSIVHFDERGAGFCALGYAKGTGKPAAVLVTSGTAVANLFPSIMEASYAQIPLIVLTGDRPPELRDNGSNQTADQVKIFGNYVRWQVDLPCLDLFIDEAYIGTTIAHAVFRTMQGTRGAVHINCMFREPLFSSSSVDVPTLLSTRYEESEPHPSRSTLESWADLLSSQKNGVIIVGANSSIYNPAPIHALAQKLGWPLFADILSGARTPDSASIPYYDLILKTVKDLKVDTVLHFGDRLVSKTLLEWLSTSAPSRYFLVADHPMHHDPKHQVTHRLVCDPALFAMEILPYIKEPQKSWHEEWLGHAKIIEQELEKFFADANGLTEPSLAHYLKDNLSSEYALFLANSMPIRDADSFFFPKERKGPIFANRGVSGIDGNIATAVGIAHGANRPLLAILGDQTFLHDLNSLALVKKSSYPVILLVINNGGGAIFSFLPISSKKELFDNYFAAAHTLTFEKAAELFDLPYAFVESQNELAAALSQKRSMLIEMHTKREENLHLHKEIIRNLCSSLLLEVR